MQVTWRSVITVEITDWLIVGLIGVLITALIGWLISWLISQPDWFIVCLIWLSFQTYSDYVREFNKIPTVAHQMPNYAPVGLFHSQVFMYSVEQCMSFGWDIVDHRLERSPCNMETMGLILLPWDGYCIGTGV